MESEEGDVSQPVPDNGREKKWHLGYETPTWTFRHPSSWRTEWTYEIRLKASQHPAWDGNRQVSEKKYENRVTVTYTWVETCIYISSKTEQMWGHINVSSSSLSSLHLEQRNGTTNLVEIWALSSACLQRTLTASLLHSPGSAGVRLAGHSGFTVYLLEDAQEC